MKKIICAVCLALLLSGNAFAEEASGVEVEVLAKTGSSWDGEALPAYPEEEPEVTILKITIAPGVRLPLHEHPVINAGVLLSGELTVITEEDDMLHLKAGDPIVEVVNKKHYGKNEGDEPAEIIVFYAGTAHMPITVKE
ncbi:cupin domain-containing protein [Candidatus Omnitrophota bacterium]